MIWETPPVWAMMSFRTLNTFLSIFWIIMLFSVVMFTSSIVTDDWESFSSSTLKVVFSRASRLDRGFKKSDQRKKERERNIFLNRTLHQIGCEEKVFWEFFIFPWTLLRGHPSLLIQSRSFSTGSVSADIFLLVRQNGQD
jgi:hypothetical protein